MDAKASFASAAPLHHVAGADRKSAWKAICERTHGNPLLGKIPGRAINARSTLRFRDTAANAGDCCGSLWTGPQTTASGAVRRYRRGRGDCSNVETAVARQVLERRLGPGAQMLDHLGGGERP